MNNFGKNKLYYIKKNLFLNKDGTNIVNLIKYTEMAGREFIRLQGNKPLYLLDNKINLNIQDTICVKNPKVILKQIPIYCGNSVKSNHPLMLKNIIPTPNFIYLSTNLITSLLMANAVTSEDSGNLVKCEVLCKNFLCDLFELDSNNSAGFFTWGVLRQIFMV